MSQQTKQRIIPSQENQWFYSCPTAIATPRIVRLLGAENQSVTELSAHDWNESWNVYHDFMRAYNYPRQHLLTSKERHMWDELADWMFAKVWDSHGTFQGELLIIRECNAMSASAVKNVKKVVSITRDYVEHIQQLRFQGRIPQTNQTQARILLVLEGWEGATFAVETAKRREILFKVNHLS